MNIHARSQESGYLSLGDRKGYKGAFWMLAVFCTLHGDGGSVGSVNAKIHQALHLKFMYFIIFMCVNFRIDF